MHCPFCRHSDSRVLDSRVADDGCSVRRRRQCAACERRFTTVEQMQLVVVKKSGVVEPFSRDKVIAGVSKACTGRPVSDADLALLGQRVETALRASGLSEVPAEEVGVAILQPLAELDPVAYLRFASVYRHFQSADDFLAEIEVLNRAAAGEKDQPAGVGRSDRRERAGRGVGPPLSADPLPGIPHPADALPADPQSAQPVA